MSVRLVPSIPRLLVAVNDVLEDAFGQRGADAEIQWTRIILQEQGLDGSGRLYALNGSLRIDFVLPALPMPNVDDDVSDDDDKDIPF